MYKYQCSKKECSTVWTLQEGSINGFVLTCPICNKGRGLFVAQEKKTIESHDNGRLDEMVIAAKNSTISLEEYTKRIEKFISRHSMAVTDKKIETVGNEIVCRMKYKMK